MRLLSRLREFVPDYSYFSLSNLIRGSFFFNLISFKEYRLLDTKCGRKLVLQPQFTALDDGHKRNNCVYRYSPKVCPSPAEPQMEPIPPPKPRLKRALLAPFQRDYVSDLVKA